MGWNELEDTNVPMPTTSTNTPQPSTDTIGMTEQCTKETYEQPMLVGFQNTTSSVRDFLANLSVLLASEEDSKILEAHYSLRFAESLGLKELGIYFLRTA